MHKKSPRNYAVGRALVEAYLQTGGTAALLRRLDRPSSAVEHYMRALALFGQQNDVTPEVKASFQHAIDGDPRRAEPRYRLGLGLLEAGRPQEALEELRRAAQLAPHRRPILLPLAKALFETGATGEAVSTLQRVVALGPSRDEIAAARALMLERDPFSNLPAEIRGDFERGIQALEEDQPKAATIALDAVIAVRPELPAGHLLRGLALQRMGDPAGALEALRHAELLDRSQALSHLYLGNLYLGQGQQEAALEQYEAATGLNPVLDEAYLRKGELALARGDLERAARAFKTLSFLNPDDLPIRRQLAEVQARQGHWGEAEHELRLALGQKPEEVALRLRLAQLYLERRKQESDPQVQQRLAAQTRKEAQRVLEAEPENTAALAILQSVAAPPHDGAAR
jgi:tetratricopeptide (TPR) repeat protein